MRIVPRSLQGRIAADATGRRATAGHRTPAPENPSNAAGPNRTPAKPVQIVFDDIRKRASLLPVGVDVNQQVISPDGKWLLLLASAADQQNLYVYSLDELSREPAVARQLTSTPGQKRNPRFTPDSKEVVASIADACSTSPSRSGSPGRLR